MTVSAFSVTVWSKSDGGQSYKRIVTIGGSITEVVYQLGEFHRIVGADTSSIYPTEAKHLPKVGYWMRVSAEGILSLDPDLVLVSNRAASQTAVFSALKTAGVQVVMVSDEPSEAGAYKKIMQVALLLGKESTGERLVRTVKEGLAANKQRLVSVRERPRVLFVYARGRKTLLVSGRNTPAGAMIQLAGGQNAVTDFEGFKPLVPEAVVKAAPDYIVMLKGGIGSLGGVSQVWTLPGLQLTPAAKAGKLIVMDDLLLLGFTGRLHTGVQSLTEQLHK